MKSAIYFPILRGKEGEIDAIGHLSPYARLRVRPLFDIQKPRSPAKSSIEQFLADKAREIASAWGTTRPLFIDFRRYGPDENTATGFHPAEHFFECSRQLGLQAIPVTGPESERGPGDRYINAVTDIAQRGNRGAAIRLPYEALLDPGRLQDQLTQLRNAFSLPFSMIDVFLDLEALNRLSSVERSDPVLLALLFEALAAVRQFSPRTTVVCGSSLPETLGKRHEWQPVSIPRTDLLLWDALIVGLHRELVGFGDYGVVYPFEIDPDKFVRPPSRIRLANKNEHLIFRAKSTEYRALCQSALSHESVSDLPRCWGAQQLSRSAAGAQGIGSPTDWIYRDTNVHIEATVSRIEAELRRRGLASSLEFDAPDSTPWMQESFLE